MFKQDRKYNLRSLTECSTMKIEKDIFEKILKDYPEIHFKLLEEADFKQKATQGDIELLQNKQESSKLVIKMFNEFAQEVGYKSQFQMT